MQQQEITQIWQLKELGVYEGFARYCPICGSGMAGVATRLDGLGPEIMEVHCNSCGLSYKPNRSLRALPTHTTLKSLGLVKSAWDAGIPVLDYPEDHKFRGKEPSIWADAEYAIEYEYVES